MKQAFKVMGLAPIILLNTPNNILFNLLIATITCDGKFFLSFGSFEDFESHPCWKLVISNSFY